MSLQALRETSAQAKAVLDVVHHRSAVNGSKKASAKLAIPDALFLFLNDFPPSLKQEVMYVLVWMYVFRTM